MSGKYSLGQDFPGICFHFLALQEEQWGDIKHLFQPKEGHHHHLYSSRDVLRSLHCVIFPEKHSPGKKTEQPNQTTPDLMPGEEEGREYLSTLSNILRATEQPGLGGAAHGSGVGIG